LLAGGGADVKRMGQRLRALGVGRRASKFLVRPNPIASMVAEILAAKPMARHAKEIADAIRENRASADVRKLLEPPKV